MPEISALLPTETNEDNPRSSNCAYSIMATPSAPLCERNPIRPAGGGVGTKVPCSRIAGSVFAIPIQLGPMSRIPLSRQMCSNSSCSRTPSPPTSAKPEEITTNALTPLRAHCCATAGTNRAGTTTNASSTSSGIASTEGYAGTLWTTFADGLTG